MAVSVAKTSTAPVLLKESDISEASDAGREPAELGEANLGSNLSVIVKAQLVRQHRS